MRILQVLHFFLPRHSAGTEVYTNTISQALSPRHDVALFFSEKNLSRTNYSLHQKTVEGLSCYEVTNNLVYRGFEETFSNPAVDAVFAEVLESHRPDIIHVQHLMLLSLNIVRLAKERGIPVVMTLNDFWLYCARFGQLVRGDGSICDGPAAGKCATCISDFKFSQTPTEKRLIKAIQWTRRISGFDLAPLVGWARESNLPLTRFARALAQTRRGPAGGGEGRSLEAAMGARERAVAQLVEAVDMFLIPSRTIRDRVVRWGIPRAKTRLTRYGIDPSTIEGDNEGLVRPAREDAITFGFIGTIAPHKGLHTLIEAFALLKEPSATLKIFGRVDYYPDYVKTLRTLAKGHNIIFRGRVSRERLGRAFREVDCLVVPSLWLENSPVVIQESYLAGVPVLTSNLGGMAELVRDGRGGKRFKTGSARDLARRMKEVVRDPSVLSKWAKRARRPLTIDEHVLELEGIYDQIRKRAREKS